MKTIITYAKYIVFIIVTAFAVDARYGLQTVQAENTAAIELIRLERQEEVYQRRYFDLSERYGPTPTHEQKIDLEKAKADWDKQKAKVNKALGLKDET
jgi:hypothetical protein